MLSSLKLAKIQSESSCDQQPVNVQDLVHGVHGGRTTLIIAFKVLILTENGQLELPPNCEHGDAEQTRSEAVAFKAITEMCVRQCPLSCGLLALAGKEAGSWEMAAARRLEACQARGPATVASSSSSGTSNVKKAARRSRSSQSAAVVGRSAPPRARRSGARTTRATT
eukprot:3114023-Pleurochrysis_carterae.AAC.1